jgi:hypothetical protein
VSVPVAYGQHCSFTKPSYNAACYYVNIGKYGLG